MKNRTITGHWGHEPISRPKTLGERHPEIMKPKSKALISKAEIFAKARARKEKEFGGADKLKAHIDSTREKIHAHMSAHSKALGNNPSEEYKRDYQKNIGRAYSE